ncbi:MAG: hypothetical protein KatS3mg131_2636 [Candidatus Tectimicrobiota bacterium]|nr:MAG: hypothetical protein KatS3mg131_2636 [Candidatus Tectomicrobia bacterium]
MQLALARLEGVYEAKVSFGEQRAWVQYDPQKVTAAQMIEAVQRAGFGAEVLASD